MNSFGPFKSKLLALLPSAAGTLGPRQSCGLMVRSLTYWTNVLCAGLHSLMSSCPHPSEASGSGVGVTTSLSCSCDISKQRAMLLSFREAFATINIPTRTSCHCTAGCLAEDLDSPCDSAAGFTTESPPPQGRLRAFTAAFNELSHRLRTARDALQRTHRSCSCTHARVLHAAGL